VRRNPKCSVCGDQPSITSLQIENYTDTCDLMDHSPTSAFRNLTVQQFKEIRDTLQPHFLLDVREEAEYQTCNLGGKLIPLNQLIHHLDQIPRDRMIVVHCKAGGRSAKAAKLLHEEGFKLVHNLEGGILAWIDQVDPSLSRY
jgi:rhodanese-related sulfurtransferase